MRIRYVIEIDDEVRRGIRRERGKYDLANRSEILEVVEEALGERFDLARIEGSKADRRHDPKRPPVFGPRARRQAAEKQAREISRAHGEAWIVGVHGESTRGRLWFVGTPRAFKKSPLWENVNAPKRGEGVRDVYIDGERLEDW
jgi:hypothetical protein